MNTDYLERVFDRAVRSLAAEEAYDAAAALAQRDAVRRAAEQYLGKNCGALPHVISKAADGVMAALDANTRIMISEIVKHETGEYPRDIAEQVVHHPVLFKHSCETFLPGILEMAVDGLSGRKTV